MSTFNLVVKNIKNVKECNLELSFESGIHALVGGNGSGKSTLMQCLSPIVKPSSLSSLRSCDISDDSFIRITINEVTDQFDLQPTMKKHYEKVKNHRTGFYEGSVFWGTRFHDYQRTISLLDSGKIQTKIKEADPFIRENLSYILHGDREHYKGLKRIANKHTAEGMNLQGIPYFFEIRDSLISQYHMSSGECILLSLLDFICNIIINKNYRRFNHQSIQERREIVLLIDEIELALHPAAIDRMYSFLNDLCKSDEYKLIVYLSTHSSEVIQKISPRDIYLIENIDGFLEVTNPCYPNYAIRNLYVPNGFDYLVLVEDVLAKIIVEKIIAAESLNTSKLVCVLPSGGWNQVLKLHADITANNILGSGKKIISVLDGDVKQEVLKNKEYANLPKTFLPIKSLEKYLKSKLVDTPDRGFIKKINDKYFNQRTLFDIIKDFQEEVDAHPDRSFNNGKVLYDLLTKEITRIKVPLDNFIFTLSEDIFDYEQERFSEFKNSLVALLGKY